MRRDRRRQHACGRRSGEFNLHVAWHVARAAVCLILGERLNECDQVTDRMEGRGRVRFVEEEDVRRQPIHVAALGSVDGLRLVPAEMLENEIVSVPVARWNGANGLEVLELLDSCCHTRAVTSQGALRGLGIESLRTDCKREADNTTHCENCSFHSVFPLNSTFPGP